MQDLPRRSVRVRLEAEVRLHRSADKPYFVRLRDVSEHGCSIELVNIVEIGEKLWIKLPGLASIEGVVRWQRDFTAGIDFATPLYPAVLEMLTRGNAA